VVIVLAAIGYFSIGCYFIGDCWLFFYCLLFYWWLLFGLYWWLLVILLLVVIGYWLFFINDY
jgi:hypothetical protein